MWTINGPVGFSVKVLGSLMALICLSPSQSNGQVPNACNNATCETVSDTTCDGNGFEVTLESFTQDQDAGAGIYTYKICSPALGMCSIDPTRACNDHDACAQHNAGTCNRACAVDNFRGLSHFNIWFPEVGNSCLPQNTEITGSCSTGNFVLGDGQGQGTCGGSATQVAKCDSISGLEPGNCLTMTINIPGEQTGPGLGLVVSKAGNNQCAETCMAGPSCEPCEDNGNGDGACLTRTRGFWGTHPHIATDLLPVTVCGKVQNTTNANVCGTSEALCTNAQDRPGNVQSLQLVAQLTAAKLNLQATAATVHGSCADWEYKGKSIQEWISQCEANFCNASKQAISGSGCIEALDAFNNSDDTGFEETPSPFDHPGPAQVDECQKARGNAISHYNCMQP